MEIKQLTEMCDTLAALRKVRNHIEETINKKRAKFEESIQAYTDTYTKHVNEIKLQQDAILKALQESNLDGWKTKYVTVSKKESKKYIIENKDQVLAWLKKKKLYDDYTETVIKPTAKEIFKEEKVPGVIVDTKEYISVLNRDTK